MKCKNDALFPKAFVKECKEGFLGIKKAIIIKD